MLVKSDRYNIGDKVKANPNDLVVERDMMTGIVWDNLHLALYLEYSDDEYVTGEIVKIKTRNWLGFKLKSPIYTIYTGEKSNYEFNFTKIEKYDN